MHRQCIWTSAADKSSPPFTKKASERFLGNPLPGGKICQALNLLEVVLTRRIRQGSNDLLIDDIRIICGMNLVHISVCNIAEKEALTTEMRHMNVLLVYNAERIWVRKSS